MEYLDTYCIVGVYGVLRGYSADKALPGNFVTVLT